MTRELPERKRVYIESLRSSNPRIMSTYFHLWASCVNDTEARDIAEALKVNNTLTELELDSNKITNAGVKDLAEALKVNHTLTTINLKNNHITDTGVIDLIEALKFNKTITGIDLSRNVISSDLLSQIYDSLRRNHEALESQNKKSASQQKTKQEYKRPTSAKQLTPAAIVATPVPTTKQQSIHRPELNQSSYAQRHAPAAPPTTTTTKFQPTHQSESKHPTQLHLTPTHQLQLAEFLTSFKPGYKPIAIGIQETVVNKADLEFVKSQITKQSEEISDINSVLDQDPASKSQMATVRTNPVLNSFYTTLFRDLNQTFNAAIVASSEKLKLGVSTKDTLTAMGAGAAVTYGMTKIGAEFLQGFPIANVLGKAVSKTADFAMNRSSMMDMRHLSKIAQVEEQDSSALCRLIARRVTLGIQDELLNSNPPQSKLSELGKLIKNKILEAIKGENRTPTERIAAEKTAEIFAFLITEGSKDLAAPGTTIKQVADAICKELGIAQPVLAAANNAPVRIIGVAARTSASAPTLSSSLPASPSPSPSTTSQTSPNLNEISIAQMQKELSELREKNSANEAEIVKLKRSKVDVENPQDEPSDEYSAKLFRKAQGLTPDQARGMFENAVDKNYKPLRIIVAENKDDVQSSAARIEELTAKVAKLEKKNSGCCVVS